MWCGHQWHHGTGFCAETKPWNSYSHILTSGGREGKGKCQQKVCLYHNCKSPARFCLRFRVLPAMRGFSSGVMEQAFQYTSHTFWPSMSPILKDVEGWNIKCYTVVPRVRDSHPKRESSSSWTVNIFEHELSGGSRQGYHMPLKQLGDLGGGK